MIKLNKQVESLETIVEKIENKIAELRKKKEAIEEKAGDEDRVFTTAEQDRFDKLEEQIEELQEEIDGIENALIYLREYVAE